MALIDGRLAFAGFLVVALAYVLPMPRLIWARWRRQG